MLSPLYDTTPLLIELHYTLYWSSGAHGQKFAPIAFAADLITENPELFLQSLDASCLERIDAATKYTMYKFDKPVNYEVERWFVWEGLEEGRLSIRGLTAGQLEKRYSMTETQARVLRIERLPELGQPAQHRPHILRPPFRPTPSAADYLQRPPGPL
ncbi:hypothetical protein VTI74DRAFT_10551 [Chaetomium olivicolor]